MGEAPSNFRPLFVVPSKLATLETLEHTSLFPPPCLGTHSQTRTAPTAGLPRPWRLLHLLPATPPWPLPSVLPAAVARASARPTLHSAASASPPLSPPAVLVERAPAETLASVPRTAHAAPSRPPLPAPPPPAPAATRAPAAPTATAKANPQHN